MEVPAALLKLSKMLGSAWEVALTFLSCRHIHRSRAEGESDQALSGRRYSVRRFAGPFPPWPVSLRARPRFHVEVQQLGLGLGQHDVAGDSPRLALEALAEVRIPSGPTVL